MFGLPICRSKGRNSRSSIFGRAFTCAHRIFSGGPSDTSVADVSVAGWAEQFARGFEARGVPRDVVGAMIEPALPLVTFDEVRPSMHFRLQVHNGERFVMRTCIVEYYMNPYSHDELPDARRKQLVVKYWMPFPWDQFRSSSTRAVVPSENNNIAGLPRQTYDDKTWNENFIAPGVLVGGQVLDMNFGLAQKNLFIAIRHGLLRIVEMILDLSSADLMLKEIRRYYSGEEQAGLEKQ